MRLLLTVALACGLAVLAATGARAQGGSEGLDRPGAHLLLALDMAEVRALWLVAMRDEVRSRLREAKIGFGRVAVADNAVQIRLGKPEDGAAALKALADLAPTAPSGILERAVSLVRGWGSDVEIAKGEGDSIIVTPTAVGLERRTGAALDNATTIITRRLEGMGVAATAVRKGRDQIHVHAPSLQDTASLKDLAIRSAALSFHRVHPTMSVQQARQGRVPAGYKIHVALPEEWLLSELPVMRGNDLADAHAALDQRTNEPVVTFRFHAAGTRTFAKITSESVGQPLAIVLDEAVLSAPVIREPILGGSGQISGNFTLQDAQRMAVLLRAGALPAKLTLVQERVVPPGR